MTGLVAGRFRIEREAGRGGMGIVYRAFDEQTSKVVAIKRMSGPCHDRARFLREAVVLARVDHPGIVRYVLHGADDAGPWLAMEWLDGRDLATVLAGGPLKMCLVLDIAAQAAEALAAANRAGIVHRDLKPANVVLVHESPPVVKVVDFGIARDTDAATVLTCTGALIGTPLYMAPEQLRGETATFASDVYAASTVLFEIIAGQPPFAGGSAFAAIGRILLEPAPPLDALCDGVPPQIVALVARGLSKDPSARPSSGDLAGSLRELAWACLKAPTVAVSRSSSPAPDFVAEQRTAAVVLVQGVLDSRDAISVLASCGAACDVLPDRTVIGLLTGPRAPDVPLLRAAQAGLRVCASSPGATVVISSARSRSDASGIEAKVFDRAHGLAASNPGVFVDTESAGLLGNRFELAWEDKCARVVSEHSTDEHRLLFGKPVPFVGRDAELLQLSALVSAAAAEGAARGAIVVAPPGHGKSRLRVELMSRLASLDFPVRTLLARFEPGSETVAFSGLARGLRSTIGLTAGDVPEMPRKRLSAFGLALGITEARLSFLASLAGVAGEQDEHVLALARASSETMRDGLRDALRAVLQGMAGDGVAVVMLEDAHWADASSLALMGELLAVRDLPAVVIAFARPELLEEQPDLWKQRSPLRLDLSPLTPRVTRRLVQAVLGGEPSEEIVGRIVDLGAGSPLVVEELLRVFVSSSRREQRFRCVRGHGRDTRADSLGIGGPRDRLDEAPRGREAHRYYRLALRPGARGPHAGVAPGASA